MYAKQSIAVQSVINGYFDGIYRGDTALLGEVFHPQALLCGDINGQPYFKTVNEYLEVVRNRKSPQELGENFRMEVLGIEMLGNNAIAKLRVPMLGYDYYDYLSLTVIEGKWRIMNKLFTHREPAAQ
ncbi:nuclear transport factor 2 family protein [Chitinophaga lutea]|uniref:Nuclear transport factor 2 family protein n=1 Tax=Chitinophaga lutea TaxID=2488634 RepID=A0A3N4QCR8_9BACT|nr:nuclear transport factor 2 family protein [Chitinophaga lutea]RPE09544.1 nuclear transport factor 2 family protein [Chitinophaga lutea]